MHFKKVSQVNIEYDYSKYMPFYVEVFIYRV